MKNMGHNLMWQKIIVVTLLMVCSGLIYADPPSPMVGAFVEIKTDRKDVQAAAEFAVKQINNGKLVKILSAKSQVVAGVNYLLILEIKTKLDKKLKYNVKVFVPLPVTKQPMQLITAEILKPY